MSHYERLGGEKPLLRLVNRFYDLMDSRPDVSELRLLHADDLSDSRDKLFMFLSGWLGGPSLYIEKFGHPRLRQRHIHFKIGELERDQWMSCFNLAMQEMDIEKTLQNDLYAALYKTADFMRNQ